jgi:hypothetical protein
VHKKERKKMKIHDYMVAKAQIWGDESHACTILYEIGTHKYRAMCGDDSRILNEKNYERVLNDMFYDYCVENASWMGVS